MAAEAWLKTIDAAAMDGEALRGLVRREMTNTRVLRLCNARPSGDPLAFWRGVGEAVGAAMDLLEDSVTGQRQIVPGAWTDVRFEPDRPDTYRHHKVGQPLHSDGAYVPPIYAQEIALFYLERQARTGGLHERSRARDQGSRIAGPLLHHETTRVVQFASRERILAGSNQILSHGYEIRLQCSSQAGAARRKAGQAGLLGKPDSVAEVECDRESRSGRKPGQQVESVLAIHEESRQGGSSE